MNWFKLSFSNAEEKVSQKIKSVLKSNIFFLHLMKEYHIPIEDIDNHLRIIFVDLQGKFAEGNGEEIKINKKLLEPNFMSDNFHFVVHEFYHWIKRRSEALFYFNDDEEVKSFVLAAAWELYRGKNISYVEKLMFPIVSGHFSDPNKAKSMLHHIVSEASKIMLLIKNQ